MRRLLLVASLMLPLVTAAAPRNIIVDTDAGTDDLMAIAFLLSRPDVHIEAITVANGLAHVPAGARNIERLLQLAGRPEIPVYEGRPTPLDGANEFPTPWRLIADELPGVDLPTNIRNPEPLSAVSYLIARLANPRVPVSVLALGPLTNIAEALTRAPKSTFAVDDMVIMGGAIRVPGNIADGGYLFSDNRTAEWNIYVDPMAARRVLESGIRCRLVPLDATNTVPIDLAFLDRFTKNAKSPLGIFCAQVLASSRVLISQHMFYAWDPLAAVALVNPAVLKISSVPLTVTVKGSEEGRTAEDPASRNLLRVALSADPAVFAADFLGALAHTGHSEPRASATGLSPAQPVPARHLACAAGMRAISPAIAGESFEEYLEGTRALETMNPVAILNTQSSRLRFRTPRPH